MNVSIGIGWRIPERDFYLLSVNKGNSKWSDFKLPNDTKIIPGINELYEEIGKMIKPNRWFCSNYYDEPADFCLVLPLEVHNTFGDQIIPEESSIEDMKKEAARQFLKVTGIIDVSKYKFSVIYGIREP